MAQRGVSAPQSAVWTGPFGHAYTERNRFESDAAFNRLYLERYGISRDDLNRRQLAGLPRDLVVVEVGCNIGNQLAALARLGFEHLYGVEIQRQAVEEAHRTRPQLDVVQGSLFELPFRDGFADLVFTNNVLIHVAPADLGRAMDEICRLSRRYVWGLEYYAPEITEVRYRGHDGLLWKADYARLFLERFPDLELVAAESFAYRDQPELVDRMYLLRRRAP